MSEPNTSTNNAPKSTPASPAPAPKFNITANSPRELMVKAAQVILTAGLFEHRLTNPSKTTGKGGGESYYLWNQDDSGKIGAYNDGITLTPEEAKMLPTTKGVPTVLSSSFVLRQLAAPAMVAAKINERQLATATREANKVTSVSDDSLLAELNRRRIAEGKAPIEG